MSVTITRLRIPKSKLALIPDRERGLFFMLGHISNELTILSRFAKLCSHYKWPEEVRGPAHVAQAMLVIRLLGGKCKEAWEFIRKSVLSSALSVEYADKLGDHGTRALSVIKRNFGGSKILHELRNEFAFHYFEEFAERLRTSFDEYTDSHVDYYWAQRRVNTLSYTADVLLNHALFARGGAGDLLERTDRIVAEVTTAAAALLDYCEAMMWAIATKYFGEDNGVESGEEFAFADAPDAENITIPVFVSEANWSPSKDNAEE